MTTTDDTIRAAIRARIDQGESISLIARLARLRPLTDFAVPAWKAKTAYWTAI